MLTPKEAQKTRKFIKHLALASKKRIQKKTAEEDLDEQLERLKQIFLKDGEREPSIIEEEIEELKKKVQKVLDIESKILYRCSMTDSRDVRIKESVKRVEAKLDKFLQEKDKRAKRMERIERKIKAEVGVNKKGIDAIETHIAGLEEQLINLKISGGVSREKAQELKQKIKAYKDKVSQLKGL